MATHEIVMASEIDLVSPLLMLPLEIRRFILTMTLATQNPAMLPFLPTNPDHFIQFDHQIIQLLDLQQIACVLSLNKQIYAEGSQILVNNFAFGLVVKVPIALSLRFGLHALDNVFHIHIKFWQYLSFNDHVHPRGAFHPDREDNKAACRAIARQLPRLRTVTLQIRFANVCVHPRYGKKDAHYVEEIMDSVREFEHVRVFVFADSAPKRITKDRKQGVKQIIAECQGRLGQKQLKASW